MVTIEQYPDKIIIVRQGQSTYDQDTGEWTTTGDEVVELKCRFVPNGSGKEVKLPDGTNYLFDYRIAFPYGVMNVLPKDEYTRVSNGEKGIIKRFEIGQLHSLAWV